MQEEWEGGGGGGVAGCKETGVMEVLGEGSGGPRKFPFQDFFSCSKQSDENSCKYKAAYGGLI